MGEENSVAYGQYDEAFKAIHSELKKVNENLEGLFVAMQKIIPYNALIAGNLTQADTNKHTLDLEAALGETRKIVAVKLACARVSGTGHLNVYPNEGEKFTELPTWEGYWGAEVDIKDGSQRLQYALAVADDVYNLYCMGYIVET